jgi:hypothetical protein
VCVASGTQRGRHARAQAKAHYKQEEGKRDTAREAGSGEFGLARSFQVADVSSSVRGGAKMDAEAVVLKELKRGRNSDKLANGLSLLTSLK